MNIVYLIGNGFDINLGLKTTYPDFYQHYKTIESKNEGIKLLKKRITDETENWSDLEKAFGQHTTEFMYPQEFHDVFQDIGDELAEYLKIQEANFNPKIADKGKLRYQLSHPTKYLREVVRQEFISYTSKWQAHQWNVNLISLNYTNILDRLLSDLPSNKKIGDHQQKPIVLQNIWHVHGTCDNEMVMGVNDVSQIANTTLTTNRGVVEALVKPTCNQVIGHTIDNQCKIAIENANLICLFGTSLGDTDKIWWEAIGQRLKHDCRLIIFHYHKDKISNRRPYLKEEIRRQVTRKFLKQTTFTKEEVVNIANKIYVGVNTEIFDIILKMTAPAETD